MQIDIVENGEDKFVFSKSLDPHYYTTIFFFLQLWEG